MKVIALAPKTTAKEPRDAKGAKKNRTKKHTLNMAVDLLLAFLAVLGALAVDFENDLASAPS